jgi:K+-transporting ATPase ATPase C chain
VGQPRRWLAHRPRWCGGRVGCSGSSSRRVLSRPSLGGRRNAAASSGSNLGPNNPVFLAVVAERVAAYRLENGLADDVAVPVDAVTTSGSGLDPHISVRNARLQAARVAAERGMLLDEVLTLIDEHTTASDLGFLSETSVNVLMLNLALDRA